MVDEYDKSKTRQPSWLIVDQSIYEKVNSINTYTKQIMGNCQDVPEQYNADENGEEMNGENGDGMHYEDEITAEVPEFFRIRKCTEYVDIDGKGFCSGCKKDRSEHVTEGYEKWYFDRCTVLEPTDAYGEVLFPAAHTKKAKYIKVETKTNSNDMLKYLYSDRGYDLEPPQLILSVTGGAQQFSIDEDVNAAFKLGLMKAAKSTNAWIITGGSNCGVMKLVGDAVAEDLNANDLTVLGIASWGCVAFRNDLIGTGSIVRYFPQHTISDRKSVSLNPNHSQFILVDDGSNGEFGVEIEFRTKLENALKQTHNIQMVLIVVEGGVGTLNTILLALRSNTPIILIADTKGCADLVRKSKEYISRPHSEDDRTLLVNQIQQSGIVRNPHDFDRITNLLEEIVNPQYNRLMNVYKIDSDTSDIEPTILQALSKSEANPFQRILLSIKWNRFDIAKMEMKQNKLKQEELYELLEAALTENRPKFVDLILEQEVDLRQFLTPKRMDRLHNHEASQEKKKNKEPILVYLQKKTNEMNLRITFEHIKKFLKDKFHFLNFEQLSLYDKYESDEFDESDEDNNIKEHHEFYLFIWCILSNRIEIAKTFWRLGKYQLCLALIASRILKIFSEDLVDFIDLEQISKEFEDLAIGLLKVYDKNTRDIINDVLIIRFIPLFGMDCLELALYCKCKHFLSSTIIQNILSDIWKGKRYDYSELTDYEKELRRSQLACNRNEKSYVFKSINRIPKNADGWLKVKAFLSVPKFRYLLNLITYLIFLLIFSYFVLFNFQYKTKTNSTIIDNRNKSAPVERQIEITNFNISYLEYILLFWIIAMLCEEARQFTLSNVVIEQTWSQKIKEYFETTWNILDLFCCAFFFIGFFLRLLALGTSNEVFVWARIVFSIDLLLFYLRALHFLLILSSLGPKLSMIGKMLGDLMYFLIIIGIFLLAFGVAIQGILSPAESFSTKVFMDLINIAYWPIYGELGILEELNKDLCSDGVCKSQHAVNVSIALLMIYMLIASVLLLNLLIAMFSSTFENIQKDSDIIWKNQRYHLILDYVDSPMVPTPLNLFKNIWRFTKLIFKSEQDDSFKRDDGIILINYEQICVREYLKELKLQEKTADNYQVQFLEERIKKLEEMLIAQKKLTMTR